MGKITVKHYLNRQLKPEIDGEYKYYPLYVSLTVNQRNIRKRSKIYLMIPEQEFEEGKSKDFLEYQKQMEYEADLLIRITTKLMYDTDNKLINSDLIYSSFNKGKSKDEFVNLLNLYIDYYSYSIFNAVQYSLTSMLRNEIYSKLRPVFTFSKERESVERMFKIVDTPWDLEQFIKDNLNNNCLDRYYIVEMLRSFLSPYCLETAYDIPLIDWQDGKIQPKLKEFLLKYHQTHTKCNYGIVNEEKANEYLSIIDDVVSNSFLKYTEYDAMKSFGEYI